MIKTFPPGTLEHYDYVVMLSRYCDKFLLSRTGDSSAERNCSQLVPALRCRADERGINSKSRHLYQRCLVCFPDSNKYIIIIVKEWDS